MVQPTLSLDEMWRHLVGQHDGSSHVTIEHRVVAVHVAVQQQTVVANPGIVHLKEIGKGTAGVIVRCGLSPDRAWKIQDCGLSTDRSQFQNRIE